MKLDKKSVCLLLSVVLNVLQTFGIVPSAAPTVPAPGTVQLTQ